jgi:hypothetical protein
MLSCSFFSAGISIAQVYKVTSSKVKFKSDAPLEVIVAESAELNGLLDVKTKLFAKTGEIDGLEPLFEV